MHPVNSTNPTPHRFSTYYLYSIPWILLGLFIASFFYDFPDDIYLVGPLEITFNGILRILSISGLIGFLTNWVAITMLFRPQLPRPVFGQGLIPAQKHVIAEKLSVSISKNLINAEHIQQKLVDSEILSKVIRAAENQMFSLAEDPEFRESLYASFTDIIRNVLTDEDLRKTLSVRILNEFENSMPTSSLEKIAFQTYKRFRGDEAEAILGRTLEQVPQLLYEHRAEFDEMIESLPAKITSHRDDIETYILRSIQQILNEIDVRSIVKQNINNYDEGRIETLIKESTIDQLRYIKYLGGVLGTFGGLFIWNPIVAFILLSGLGSILYISDITISRLK